MFRLSRIKKHLLFLIIIAVIGSFIFWQYSSNNGDVYMRVVTSEDGPELSESMIDWIAQKKTFFGIHAYGREDSGFYELLVLDNRHSIENLYLHTEVESQIKNNALIVEFADNDALSDSEVRYNEKLYLILKEKPTEIKVFVDGNPYEITIQSGGMPITR